MFTTAKLKAENRSLQARIAELEKALTEEPPAINSQENVPALNDAVSGGLQGDFAEEQIWTIFDQVAIAVVKVAGETNNLVRYNPAFGKIFGYEADSSQLLSIEEITYPDDLERSLEKLGRLNKGETDSFQIENRYIKKNGDHLWGRTTVTHYYSTTKKRRFWLAFIVDISHSKKAELALRESEERFELAVKGSNDGLWDWIDVDKELMWMSPRLYELLGYGSDDTLPTISLFKALLHPDDVDRVSNHMVEHINDRAPYDIEYRMMTGSKEYKWFRARGQAVWDEHGQATRVSGSLTDISAQKSYEEELKKYAEQLRISKERAEAGTKTKSEFLANMSHEIRTPMNGILGYAEVLLETSLSKEQREYVSIVLNNGSRLMNLLDSILDISKIESGQLEMENRSFNLTHLLEDTFETIRPAAYEKGLTLNYQQDQSVPDTMVGDDIRLGQVFVNLLSNAVKFTEQGCVELLVHSEQMSEDKIQLHFIVMDTGIGISSADKIQIFEKFTQIDNSATRRYSGSGLGLAISYQLVKRMNGEIWVESEEGLGSSFHVKVELGLLKQTPEMVAAGHNTPLTQIRVLFAVDDAINEQRLSRQLKAWGMKVLPVRNALDAEEALNALEGVDLCIIDVAGDNAGGLSVARQLRELGGPALPIVLMSDDSHNNYIPDIVTLSVVKPVAGAQLHQLLSALVRNSEMAQEALTLGGSIMPVDTMTVDTMQPGGSMRILLVEDEVDNQKLALHFLSKLGHEVTLASNGVRAVEAFEESFFDIILMDIQMPEMDGQTATTHIRRATHHEGQPWIIAVTARAMVGDRERFLDAGMDDYLSKPYSKESLVRVVEKALAEISMEKGRVSSGYS